MKYLVGSEKRFHDFVKSLTNKDNICIVTHTDVDGIASAIFLQKILESRKLKVKFTKFISHDREKLNSFIENNKCNKIFFVDFNLDGYFDEFIKLERLSPDFLVVDHHPINEDLRDRKNMIKTCASDCSAYCLYNFAKKYFDVKRFEWLVCAALIMDHSFNKEENLKFIQSIYPKTSRDNIWNSEPADLGRILDNAKIYYEPNFQRVYDFVLKEDFNELRKTDKIIQNEIDKLVKKFVNKADYFSDKRLYFYYGNPRYKFTSAVCNIISSRIFPEATIIFVSDIKDKKGFVKVSARNQTGKVDLNVLLKKSLEGFDNANAGGHPKAAAGSFMKRDLNQFKENIIKLL